MMQKTRQKIIEYLKENGEATVEELSQALDNLTAVTVRHHLDVLRSQGLVGTPITRHRNSPGRPKYVFSLTDKADTLFPKNLCTMTDHLLDELKGSLSDQQIGAILQGVAERMADEPTAVWRRTTVDPIYDQSMLRQKHVFTSVIRLTYGALR